MADEFDLTPEKQAQIDAMSQVDLCWLWRHAPIGEELFKGTTGDYFKQRLAALGGFTPEISKAIGWGDR